MYVLSYQRFSIRHNSWGGGNLCVSLSTINPLWYPTILRKSRRGGYHRNAFLQQFHFDAKQHCKLYIAVDHTEDNHS